LQDPRNGLDVRERSKGKKTIKNSIIGQNLVDWILDQDLTLSGSRLEAVQICEALLNTQLILDTKRSKKNQPLKFDPGHHLYVLPLEVLPTKESGSQKKSESVFALGHAFTRRHMYASTCYASCLCAVRVFFRRSPTFLVLFPLHILDIRICRIYQPCDICQNAIWGIGRNCYQCTGKRSFYPSSLSPLCHDVSHGCLSLQFAAAPCMPSASTSSRILASAPPRSRHLS
jgi:hypothetical protein